MKHNSVKTLNSKNGSMLPVIFTLAWPTMLEQLMHTAVQYVDTAMVGSLGTAATAAVGATSTVGWLVNGTVHAFGVGFLAYIARAYGAKDRKKAVDAVAQAVFIVLAMGLFTTAVTMSLSSAVPRWMNVDPAIHDLAARYFLILYAPMLFRSASNIFGTVLRAVGDTKTPMKVGVWVNLINVALNFLFIYPTRQINIASLSFTMPGLGMGVTGAALASAIAFTFGGAYITIVLFRHPEISPKGHSIKPDMEILKPCFRVAIPNMLQRFGTSLGFVAFASMINSLGQISTAAHTIANTVESAFYIPGYGMQTAAATLAGNIYGAGDKDRLKRLAGAIIPLEISLMVISGGLLFIFAPQLMGIFSKDADVIALGGRVLRMVAVSEPFYGVSIVVEGMMQGMGKTMLPFIFSISGMWGIRIVGTFICTRIFSLGLTSAWACMISHNLFLFCVYVTLFLTGKWKPVNMRDEKNRKKMPV